MQQLRHGKAALRVRQANFVVDKSVAKTSGCSMCSSGSVKRA